MKKTNQKHSEGKKWGDQESPCFFIGIQLKTTLLGSLWESERLPVPANLKNLKNF